MGLLAGLLGYAVTDVSCRQPDLTGVGAPCTGWAILIGILSLLVVTAGVALLLVLVFRSLAEWRESSRRD